MSAARRIFAVAQKEWRLNMRFAWQYFSDNLIAPTKTGILMYCIYHGLLKEVGQTLGMIDRANFALYVLVGTICHTLVAAAIYSFRSRMRDEKFWQTITATILSPISVMEVVLGFVVGSVGPNLLISAVMLIVTVQLFPVPFDTAVTAMLVLLLLAFLGFGLGVLGSTIALCWEGKAFLFDYAMQAMFFLSCFYYPLEVLPRVLHPVALVLPTYQASRLLHELFVLGISPLHSPGALVYILLSALTLLYLPALFWNYSIRRYGVEGY